MGLLDKNMPGSEAFIWVVAGFVIITAGLIAVIYTPYGISLTLLGLVVFFFGYNNVNPFKGVAAEEVWIIIGLVITALAITALFLKFRG
jgi:hypothetical protein